VVLNDGKLLLETPINSRLMMEITGITGHDRLHHLDGDNYRFAFMRIEFSRDRSERIDGFTLIHESAGLRIPFNRF
jgi:hypothetical protein